MFRYNATFESLVFVALMHRDRVCFYNVTTHKIVTYVFLERWVIPKSVLGLIVLVRIGLGIGIVSIKVDYCFAQ